MYYYKDILFINHRTRTVNPSEALLDLCKLAQQRFQASKILNAKDIEAWRIFITYSENLIKKSMEGKKLNAYQRKTLESEILKYWNSTLNIEVEKFWTLVEEKNLPFKRNNTFEKIIATKRFKNVEQAIDIYNDIYNRPIHDFDNVELRTKLDKLYEVVQIDRNKRIKQFRKWLRNKNVSISDRGKFGENYAYMKNTGQFEDIFGKEEQEIIATLIRR